MTLSSATLKCRLGPYHSLPYPFPQSLVGENSWENCITETPMWLGGSGRCRFRLSKGFMVLTEGKTMLKEISYGSPPSCGPFILATEIEPS